MQVQLVTFLLIRLPHCISPPPPSPPVPEPPSISDGGMRFVGGASLGQEYMDTQPPQQLVASPQGVRCGREGRRREGLAWGCWGEVSFQQQQAWVGRWVCF